jgi:hypothetical protein
MPLMHSPDTLFLSWLAMNWLDGLLLVALAIVIASFALLGVVEGRHH